MTKLVFESRLSDSKMFNDCLPVNEKDDLKRFERGKYQPLTDW